MLKTRSFATGFMLLACVASAAHAQSYAEIAGGWVVTSWTSPDGETNSEPQRGLFVFTETGHYSIMHVNAERANLDSTSTDADALAAYGPFTANSGRYRIDGNQLTYEAFVAKNPNYMGRFGSDPGNGVTVNFSITDGILTLEWTGGNNGGRKATLRRGRGTRAQN